MKKILSLLLLLFIPLHAEEKISISLNPGYSIFNSENGMTAIGPQRIRWLPGVSLAYERENVYGYAIHLEYNLTYWRFPTPERFPKYSADSPLILQKGDAVFILAINNLDLDLHHKLSKYVSVDLGPTLSMVARSINVEDYDFTDRLVSIGAGANAGLTVEVPFSEKNEHLYFFSGIKMRYHHSILIDARGRNVDDYYQSFLYGQLHLGVGYIL